jgi:hypothetical protein
MKQAQRYIPSGATELIGPDELSAVYAYEASGVPYAICYIGRSAKPAWHHRFKSAEQREQHIERQWESIRAHQRAKAERKAERQQPHDLKVGDVVYNSWGYDQTNVDYYQVVKATDHYVWLRKTAADTTETGFMSGSTTPRPGVFISEKVTQHGARMMRGESWISFEFGSGQKWRGGSRYTSWYA